MFSNEQFNIPAHKQSNRLVEIIIGLDSFKIGHIRNVVQIEEFLGNIAGIYGLLMSIMYFIFGDYISF